ncbi:MAG: FlgD immunoglobulin-like domain containing protein [Candidatus Eisenbacteria bacterium]
MKKVLAIAGLAVFMMAGLAYGVCGPDGYAEVTIQQIQLGLGVLEGDTVWVDSVVVTGLRENGFWVSELLDTAAQFSGIFAYTQAAPTVSPGDLVNMRAEYIEYNDWSELRVYRDPWCYEVIGTANIPVPAGPLTCCDINDSLLNTAAEPWEGVLVYVDSVQVTNTYDFGNFVVKEYDADAGCATVETLIIARNAFETIAVPDSADSLARIIGVVDYNSNGTTFGYYALQPRTNNDIVFLGLPPAPRTLFAYPRDDSHLIVVFDRTLQQSSAENVANYFVTTFDILITAAVMSADSMQVELTTTDMSIFQALLEHRELTVQNVANAQGVAMTAPNSEFFVPGVKNCELIQTQISALNDSSVIEGLTACVGAIVTAVPNESYANRHLFVQDRNTAFGAGLDCYVSGYPNIATFPVARGDSVLVAGLVEEWYRLTELSPVDYIEVVSSGHAVPDPVTVPVALINGPPETAAEAYESKLVRIENVVVLHPIVSYGEWYAEDGAGDSIMIDDLFDPGIDPYVPALGDSFAFIQGVLTYQFDDMSLEPRDQDDIFVVGLTGVEGDVPAVKNDLAQNRPNPFNPTTTIHFSLESRSEVSLKVFDVAGREVRALENRALQAGQHSVTWDGTNNQGQAVSSGIYFYRIEAGRFESTKKMVLLR